MAELTPERVREALRTVLFPNFRRDLVTLGMVGEEIAIDGDTVRLHVRPGTDKPEVLQQLALAGEGRRRVGLVDADVYGPSLPIMFGTDARPRVGPDKRIHPLERHGI